MVGIYRITNTFNDKVYIGQSVDVKTRIRSHKRELEKGTHYNTRLQADYNTFGKEWFNYEVIHKCRSIKLNELEKSYIKSHNSTDKNYGYNISKGCGKTLIKRIVQSEPQTSHTAKGKRVNAKDKGILETYLYSENSRDFFAKDGRKTYNDLCNSCENGCKQSFRAEIMICPKLKKRMPK